MLFVMLLLPPSSTLFPYTTLFRSRRAGVVTHAGVARAAHAAPSARAYAAARHARRRAVSEHGRRMGLDRGGRGQDRKSTRLNSSHMSISYAVFCLKKKKSHDNIV